MVDVRYVLNWFRTPAALQELKTEQKRRTYETAFRQLTSMLLPGESQALVDVQLQIEELGRRFRKTVPGIKPSTTVTYESRCRATIQLFQLSIGTTRPLPMTAPGTPQMRSLTVDEQITEALVGLSRWPALRNELMPHLLAAMDHHKKKTE